MYGSTNQRTGEAYNAAQRVIEACNDLGWQGGIRLFVYFIFLPLRLSNSIMGAVFSGCMYFKTVAMSLLERSIRI